MNPLVILAVSLFAVPLCGPIIIEPVLAIHDLWTTKEFLVLMAILAMQHRATSCNVVQRRNPFLIALLLFLPISTFSAPPLQLIYGHANIANLWIWCSLAWCFAYFMLYQALGGQEVQEGQKKAIIQAIGWAAIISAGYAYIQALGLDQYQIARAAKEIGNPVSVNITAVIGNPTYLAVWLVMCLPFLALFFRWYWTVFVVGAVLLCKSDFGLAGLVLVPILLACLRAKSTIWLKIIVGVGLTICVLVGANWREIRPKLHDNGRFAVWAQTFQDWKAPCIKLAITDDMSGAQKAEIERLNRRTYSLTGRGLGSFPYIFGAKYTTNYDSAHNEYLEALYSIGLIGLTLFLVAIGWVFWHGFALARADTFCLALYTSFFFCCFAAFGLPIWHLEPTRFYSATMFILLSKNNS